ncbi:MAG: DUF4935 domain-containing protein [Gammaproteobacteria bacterium]|nr:DUF4935 domain-containing protein [Gammaproteobacteria bacterium]
MSDKLEARTIFIDTQAFMQQGFRFEKKVLSRLSELGKSMSIKILISDVVRQEVSSKLTEKLTRVSKLKKDLLKEIGFLGKDIPRELVKVLDDIDESVLLKAGEERWANYLKSSNITVLSPNDVCNEELLRLYFKGYFPFSDGKKKNEFPDAISLLSLKSWAEKQEEKVYVISNDGDFKGFCETRSEFISISRLSEFLDLYNRTEKRLTAIVHNYAENNIDWLKDCIKDAFLECYFDYSDNWEADIEDVNVTSIDVFDIDIIEIEEQRAVLTLKASISCSANISGPDYDEAVWDNEDKKYLFVGSFSNDMLFDGTYDVSIEVFFSERDKVFTQISEILFNGNNSITLYYDNDHHYR